MSEFPVTSLPPDVIARAIVARNGLKVWRALGADGVNVHDKALADELAAAGCRVRMYQPELLSKPDRLAWECVLPNPEPEEADVELEEETT